ncbi:MAG TPA: hypothetical protein VJ836_06295 [Candidatus Saccharimonadales bacterium]|nr:hypothetical protein [Candidatus Saccharimonadales bacterium]
MEQYWPQHRVFFMGVLALFPDKLNGHDVNQWFYRPYFIADDPDFIVLELEEYRKAGYLQYEKTGALYRITSIDTQEATTDLIKYLEQWQQNKLLSLPASKPPDTARQQELWLDALARACANNENEPRITLETVYDKSDEHTYEPTFWELVLSRHLIDGHIKITYMDYGRRIDGLYDDGAQPLIDFSITNDEVRSEIKRRLTQRTQLDTPMPSSNIVSERAGGAPTSWEGRVIKEGRVIHIAITGDATYTIARLEQGGSYDTFMDYILDSDNTDIDVSIEDIKRLKGLQSATSLSLLARYAGFVKPFKKAFFTTSNKDRVRFKRVATLSDEQVKAIKYRAEKV